MTNDKTLKRALELAHEGVEMHSPNSPEYKVCAALIALAQPEQEPVGVVGTDLGGTHLMYGSKYVGTTPDKKTAIFFKDVPIGAPLYTTPPERTWVGLTDEERAEFDKWVLNGMVGVAHAIEAKLKEKNT